VDLFQQTLGILAGRSFSSHANVVCDPDYLPLEQVARFNKIYSKFVNARLGVPDVFKERLRYISDKLLPTSYVDEPTMEIPSPSPETDSNKTPSPGVAQRLRGIQVRIGRVPDSGFVDGGSSTPTRD
jgi:hypothetical protein